MPELNSAVEKVWGDGRGSLEGVTCLVFLGWKRLVCGMDEQKREGES